MNEHCRGCIRYMKSCSGLSKELCEKHKLRIPRTNADRIRAMTDEELAEWLDNVCKSAYDEGYTKDSEPLMSPYPSIASEWHTWLKQEVDG